MGGNNGRLVIAEEQIGKLEDMVIETRQNEIHRKKILKPKILVNCGTTLAAK